MTRRGWCSIDTRDNLKKERASVNSAPTIKKENGSKKKGEKTHLPMWEGLQVKGTIIWEEEDLLKKTTRGKNQESFLRAMIL